MSIASLKEELLRELAVSALADNIGMGMRRGAGTDLIDWLSGPPDVFRRTWVFNDKGPALIVKHVTHGARVWFAPGTLPTHAIVVDDRLVQRQVAGDTEVVVKNVVYQIDDHAGVTKIHVIVSDTDRSPCAIFAYDGAVAHFLENVLGGHVQDG